MNWRHFREIFLLNTLHSSIDPNVISVNRIRIPEFTEWINILWQPCYAEQTIFVNISLEISMLKSHPTHFADKTRSIRWHFSENDGAVFTVFIGRHINLTFQKIVLFKYFLISLYFFLFVLSNYHSHFWTKKFSYVISRFSLRMWKLWVVSSPRIAPDNLAIPQSTWIITMSALV